MSPEKIHAALLGGAVGDAIGLPYEGLSQRRARRMAKLPLVHRLVFSHGMVSDDTDHSVFVAQAILRSRGDVKHFRSVLAWRLRFWFLSLPAGIGMATLKSCFKLCIAWPRSAVYSAGNGPSMRSAIIGAMLADDPIYRAACVTASTQLTHSDPKALAGAMAMAEIAAKLSNGEWIEHPDLASLKALLLACNQDLQWLASVEKIVMCLQSSDPLVKAQEEFGTKVGISGFTLHSVPFAIIAWYVNAGDYRRTIECITQAGGDVDTVAAMAGALAGIQCGIAGIPAQWVSGIVDWPHSTAYLQRLAYGTGSTLFSTALFLRSPIFMLIVLAHGFRRLLPPY